MMRPGMLDPYSRVFAGWLTPVEIMTDGYYPIQRTFTVVPKHPLERFSSVLVDY